jgi:hypothetical protein
MIGRYWWSNMDKENKIHWVSWENMMKPKKDGGLGFRDLYSFNLAMLARQAWRILKNPTSLCAQVLAAKYFSNQLLLNAEVKNGISYCWRSILKGIQVLKKALFGELGMGRISTYGLILGSQEIAQEKFNPGEEVSCSQKSPN